MFFFNWLKSALGYLGLHQKNAKLVFLGLDNAGKSTMLQMLKDDRMAQLEPTTHPQSEELVMGSIKFRTFDLGGHEIARKIWRDYLGQVDAIIFMVDSTDRERFPLSRHELHELLESEELQNTPFLIFGNKIDMADAASEDEIRCELGLDTYILDNQGKDQPGVRPVGLFMCSVKKRSGYAEGFKWVSQFLS
jgi:GTP-binding protein SAR1